MPGSTKGTEKLQKVIVVLVIVAMVTERKRRQLKKGRQSHLWKVAESEVSGGEMPQNDMG